MRLRDVPVFTNTTPRGAQRGPGQNQIAAIFEGLKAEHEGALEVQVTAAFELKPAQQSALAEALKKKYGREIRISSEHDPGLIGGVRIRAGDQVIASGPDEGRHLLARVLGFELDIDPDTGEVALTPSGSSDDPRRTWDDVVGTT